MSFKSIYVRTLVHRKTVDLLNYFVDYFILKHTQLCRTLSSTRIFTSRSKT